MKKQILIIEDDEILAQQMLEALDTDGYAVRYASTGQAALEITSRENFDLCLVDYKLEDISGAEILKQIKKKDPSCRVLVVSGKPYIEKILQQENVFDLADVIIHKPFNVEFFLKEIEKLLSAASGAGKSPRGKNP